MWHFGKDALTSYSGEKFDMNWKDILNVHHIYSKEYEGKKMKVRKEIQEYSNKPLEEAFMKRRNMKIMESCYVYLISRAFHHNSSDLDILLSQVPCRLDQIQDQTFLKL